MKTVARHRACQGCGYDLFGLAPGGVCPECGRGIGGLSKRSGPKNPRRVAGQLRRMLVQSKRVTYLVAVFWLVPSLALVACWWFGARWWVWGIVSLALLSGVIQHLAELSRRQEWTQQLEELGGDCDG